MNIKESFDQALYNIEHMPYNSHGFVELRGSGISQLKDALRHSHGSALLLVHPLYKHEADIIERKRLWSVVDAASRYRVERFDAYAHRLTAAMHEAQAADTPIILLLDVPSDMRSDPSIRTLNKLKDVISYTQKKLVTYGYRGDGTLFYLPTHPNVPLCQLDKRDEPKSVVSYTDEVFTQLKNEAGLAHAVIGGGYFGGYNAFGNAFEKPQSYDPVALQFASERLQMGISDDHPHVFELISPQGCVKEAMTILSLAHISFRVQEGLVYPQDVPKIDELVDTGWGYEWVSQRRFENFKD